MDERIIERKLVNDVKKRGGIAFKFVSTSFNGVPDRLILMIHKKIAFVEVKAPNKKPRPLQLAVHKKIEKLGFKVYVIDNQSQIGGILDEIQST